MDAPTSSVAPAPSLRVVSLVPSATETLVAWGVTPVGVTRFCGHPELPQVGGTKDPDIAAIVALAPDLVVLCDEENRLDDADALEAAGLALHVLVIRTVADVGPALAPLRARLGRPTSSGAEAEGPGVPMHRSGHRPVPAFVPVWRSRCTDGSLSYQTLNAATYGASVLAAAGIVGVFGDDPQRYPTTTLAEAAARGPQLVIAPSEPYPFSERHRVELERVAPVVFVDGQDLFWWGVRTPSAVGRLTRLLAGITGGR